MLQQYPSFKVLLIITTITFRAANNQRTLVKNIGTAPSVHNFRGISGRIKFIRFIIIIRHNKTDRNYRCFGWVIRVVSK